MNIKVIIKRILPKKWLNLRHLFYAWYGAVKYSQPSEEMLVIGVTGTTGKSSTIHFLRQMLEMQGYKVGSLSTVDFYIAGEQKLNDKKMTMLGKTQAQKYLREMVDAGCTIAIVETTSEGYLQYRHKFINYDILILTGLYPEHIESHGSFENYKEAKLGIAKYVSECKEKKIQNLNLGLKNKKISKTIIVNGNCKYAKDFLELNLDKKIIFARDDKKIFCKRIPTTDSRIFVNNINVTNNGLDFTVGQRNFQTKLYGEYNVMNILAGISILRILDIPWSKIEEVVSDLKFPPGRLEFIPETEGRGFQILIDYAFEPVALNALYQVVEKIKPKRVIHICGSAGGGRDKSRREPIGKLVGEKADIFIITNEDPYDEDPIEIIKQISIGAKKAGKILNKNLFEILDRKQAIQKAISLAKKDDLILITGKGSEQAICVANGKMISWDDRAVVRKILSSNKNN